MNSGELGPVFLENVRGVLDSALDSCRGIFEGGYRQVWQKRTDRGGLEPVTDLDRSVEEYLVHAIRSAFGEVAVVAEETQTDLALLSEKVCFVIDPLDGTREFITAGDGYCVSVALFGDRRPLLGVLDFPARRQRFWAGRGDGATMNSRRIRIPRPSGQPSRRVAVSPAQAADRRFRALAAGLPAVDWVPRRGLCAKLAGVATGQFDAALFLGWQGSRAPIWDFAASGLILEEAGGRFTDEKGVPLMSALPSVHFGGWVATNGFCHGELLEVLREYSSLQ